jgi:hypothetical protein
MTYDALLAVLLDVASFSALLSRVFKPEPLRAQALTSLSLRG